MTERISQSGSHSQQAQFYVTQTELLNLAKTNHCAGIQVEPVLALCRPKKNPWVFEATFYESAKCRGCVGYGDAHPGNVSPLIFNHAEMCMAEARAVNCALRKAYGVALCLLEELPPWAFFCQSRFPSCATPFSTDRRFRKEEFCTRPERIRHALSHWPALLRAWAEKS